MQPLRMPRTYSSRSLREIRAAIVIGATWLLNGCIFDQMERSEEQDVQRVEQKQALLRAEQDKSVTLKQQEEELVSELSERLFSYDQLNDRVQKINVSNGRAIGGNEASRAHYEELLAQLQNTNEQLAASQQQPSTGSDERRQRVAMLRDRLRVQLDLLLR